MINDAIIVDALVSVTVNSQQRPALNMSSRVQKCMLTDRRRHREKREQVHYSFKTVGIWSANTFLAMMRQYIFTSTFNVLDLQPYYQEDPAVK